MTRVRGSRGSRHTKDATPTRSAPVVLNRRLYRGRRSNRCGAQEKETRGYLFAFILIRHYLGSESLAERDQRDQLQRHSSCRTRTRCCFDRNFYLENAQLITNRFSTTFLLKDIILIYRIFYLQKQKGNLIK